MALPRRRAGLCATARLDSRRRLLDVHPITGEQMQQSSWWIVETKR
jgi:hypothetical protein